jgi:ribonuclease HI
MLGVMTEDALRDELLRLERALACRDRDALPGGYAAVLHGAFRETGASGRAWTRDEMLAMLEDVASSGVEIEAFAVERLADSVVLATYETGGARPARRMSVWVHDGGRWRIRYHQGTLT